MIALPKLIVPPLPPVTLNVEPAAPVSVPAVAPHVPVTALRFTPFVPPLEVTFANVPLTAPVVRFRAVTAETLTDAPIVSVPKFVVLVMPVVVVPPMVTPASVRFELAPCSETPVPALLIVPPLTVTVPLTMFVRAMPVVGPVPLTLVKVTPEPPTVMALRLRVVAAAPDVRLAVPVTFSVPPPEAWNGMPVVVVTFSVPLKLIVAPAFVVIVTPLTVVFESVCEPVNEIVPEVFDKS